MVSSPPHKKDKEKGVRIPVRMAVESRRLTMGGPTRVCDTSMRVEDLCHVQSRLVDELLELCDFPNLFEGIDLVLFVAVDGQAGGIIPTVFET